MTLPSLCNNESLTETLDRATAAALPDSHTRTPQPPAWVETVEGAAFLQDIEAAKSLKLFDGTLQMIGNGGSAVGRNQLANWMVERARAVGAKQTLQDVERYITQDTFEAHQVMVLSGLPVESEMDIGGGVRLVPTHAVPNQHLQVVLGRGHWNELPTPDISSTLIRSFTHEKVHSPQDDQTGEGQPSHGCVPDEVQQALTDAHLCLALVRTGGCGVQALGSTTVAGDQVPILNGFGWWTHSYRAPRFDAPLIDVEGRNAKRLHESFISLEASDQKHLRIPMQKLNECVASSGGVQAAIDLRLALESLFLNDNTQGELRYRLALRAALFTGGDRRSRVESRKKINDVYDACSDAIHNGSIASKKAERADFKWAREVVQGALRRMILEGNARPDWGVIELQGGLLEDE